MKTPSLRRHQKKRKAYHVASLGRVRVPVYQRTAPNGSPCFMVANYANGKRRFDSYATEADAIGAAGKLARQLSERDVLTASMTRDQAIQYASAMQALKPFDLALVPAVTTLTEAVKLLGDLPSVVAAAKFYAARHKRTVAKRVADLVADLLVIKESRDASARYLQDLRYRLNRFAEDFQCDACNVTTAQVQAWLDRQNLKPQGYTNFRRVLSLLFKFAVARGYASDNPVEGAERAKVRNGDVEIFTPIEMTRLLSAASPNFLPCLVIGAFAGLRSAEIERLRWDDVHLAEKFIVIGAKRSKTASRRIVPVQDNLADWLRPYVGRQGMVWPGTHDEFYDAQQVTAQSAGLKWKSNALRHSFASYRFAQTGDAGRVAGELGNSAAVVHRHYRELVKPADAVKWFSIAPGSTSNARPRLKLALL